MARKQPRTVKPWLHYELKNAETATAADLAKAVRRAAKAANQRLLRLERAGATGGVYKRTTDKLGRKRFKERTDKLSLNALRQEYRRLRSFLSSKTSTVQGRSESDRKRYETAVRKGYKGTMDEFYDDIERLFSERVEGYFSSNTIYKSIIAGEGDLVDTLIDNLSARDIEESKKKGEALKALIRQKQAEKARGDKSE